MTTYYVDFTNGADANNGLGPDASHATNKPWKTIAKLLGASGMASGDTAYLAPGTFREVVTVAMTSAVAETSIIGDPGNAQGFKTAAGARVTPGDVVWTAYTTNDISVPSASSLLTLAGRDFLTFQYLILISGSATNNCVDATITNSINITFRDCTFIPGATANNFIRYDGLADVACNWTFDRCVFTIGGTIAIRLGLPTSASADYDVNFLARNCLFLGSWDNIISINTTGAASFKPGGVDVLNCTMIGRTNLIIAAGTSISTSIPCTVYNSILAAATGTALNSGAAGQLVEDYNKIHAATPRTNVTAGANSIATAAYPILLEFGQAALMGRIARSIGMPSASSPLLGFGSTGAPSVDILNRPRPAGGASTNNAIGAYERHDTATQETTTVRTGSSALVIVGPGDHDFELPVDAAATTVTIYGRYDATHAATNKPQMAVANGGECGVNDATATMTAAADTWEQLSLSFTPTRAGIVTIRLISRSAAGGGRAFFDDFGVTT